MGVCARLCELMPEEGWQVRDSFLLQSRLRLPTAWAPQ